MSTHPNAMSHMLEDPRRVVHSMLNLREKFSTTVRKNRNPVKEVVITDMDDDSDFTALKRVMEFYLNIQYLEISGKIIINDNHVEAIGDRVQNLKILMIHMHTTISEHAITSLCKKCRHLNDITLRSAPSLKPQGVWQDLLKKGIVVWITNKK